MYLIFISLDILMFCLLKKLQVTSANTIDLWTNEWIVAYMRVPFVCLYLSLLIITIISYGFKFQANYIYDDG